MKKEKEITRHDLKVQNLRPLPRSVYLGWNPEICVLSKYFQIILAIWGNLGSGKFGKHGMMAWA